ncbi:uncharacterized protein LOC101762095 isoform X1 [Setaria italica]|uniref:uncharacterized protein LOC101762095 isoform X1 n=1 Tax=Setaria italica TaxID=4555 RepID=UPI000BE573EC|nr:uncharacterized protein LOC101762095 isoform X1 [Setaria italica]
MGSRESAAYVPVSRVRRRSARAQAPESPRAQARAPSAPRRDLVDWTQAQLADGRHDGRRRCHRAGQEGRNAGRHAFWRAQEAAASSARVLRGAAVQPDPAAAVEGPRRAGRASGDRAQNEAQGRQAPGVPGIRRPQGGGQGLLQELGIYLLSFDRPGYAESDAHPARTEKSIALDIAELADNLQLGPKFHLIGFSMGGEIMWSCLKYIPHRLAGVAILAPVGNYWWSGFPADVVEEAWYVQFPQDQRAVWVAHHLPWLTHWWNTQNLFHSSSVKGKNPIILSKEDTALSQKFLDRTYKEQVRQLGEHDSLHRDMMVGFGKWGWSPLEMENPFAGAGDEVKVHLWHGVEDLFVPVQLSRYISKKLPWVIYHELPTAGHLFPAADGMPDVIVRSLLLGDE